MKKILQIFVFFLCLLAAETGRGQYVNEVGIRHYANFVLSPHNGMGRLNEHYYWEEMYYNNARRLKDEYLKDRDYYFLACINPTASIVPYNYFEYNNRPEFISFTSLGVKNRGAFYETFNDYYLFVGDFITMSEYVIKIRYQFGESYYYQSNYEPEFHILQNLTGSRIYTIPIDMEMRYISIPIHIPLKTELNRDRNLYDNYLPINGKIKIYGRLFTTIAANTDLEKEIYNYQYRFVRLAGEPEDVWKDFKQGGVKSGSDSAGESKSILELSATDLFGSEDSAKSHLGKKVQIRVASLKYQGEYLSWSEPTIPLTIVPSAPTALEVFSQLACAYDRGDMKVKISRKPYSNERVKLRIENENGQDAGLVIENAVGNDITNLLLQSASATPEVTVKNASEGTYKIALEGTYTYVDASGQTQTVPTYSSSAEHTHTIKIEAPAPLEASLSNVVTTPASCYGVSDGSLSLSGVSGGTPPYSYQLSKSDGTLVADWQNFPQPNSFSVQGIPQGNYLIKLKDAKGCVVKHNGQEVQLTATVSGPSQALELIAIAGNPNHYDKKGEVRLQVLGGTPPYVYEIREGSNAGNVQETGTITASGTHRVAIEKLLSGNYYAKITDAKGCRSENLFSIKAPLGIVSSSHTDVPCYGDSVGSISFEVRGGTPPYRYEIPQKSQSNRSFTGNTATITALEKGSYDVMVFDSEGKQAVSNGTPVTITKTISAPQRAIEIRRSGNASNYGTDIEVTIIGGTPKSDGSYDFEWRNQNASGSVLTSGITTAIRGGFIIRLTNLSAGAYHLTIKDAKGCEQTATYTISLPIGITHFSSTDIKCYGAANGSFTLRVDGGKAPYAYRLRVAGTTEGNWQTFQGNEITRNNLLAGNYELEVRDADGDVATVAGQTDVRRFSVVQPASALQVFESPTGVSGNGRSDGSLLVEAKGGTPSASGYVVVLQDAQNRTISPLTNLFASGTHRLEFSGLSQGQYRLRVTDAHYAQSPDAGCWVEKNIQITAPESLQVSLSIKKGISCHRQTAYNTSDHNRNGVNDSSEDGQLQAQVKGGTLPYAYAWYRIEGTNRHPIGTNENTVSGVSAGVYLLEITDKNNQKASAQITLNEPPALQWQIGADSSGCAGSAEGKAWINVQGGTPPYQYLWSNGATTARIENLASGTYTVEVTDANGCQLLASVVVGTASPMVITQETLTPPTCANTADGRISLTVQGGSGTYAVRWNDGVTTLQRNGLVAGTYTLTITDGTPCGFLQKTFTIAAAQVIDVNVPAELMLCQGDTQLFDIAISDPQARYQWQRNGVVVSAESKWLIDQEGTYVAKIIDSRGCEHSKSMQVQRSHQALEVNFLVTSYAFYDYAIRLVNVGDRLETWQWEVPKEAEVISQSADHIDLKFPKEGTYTVGLFGAMGDCQKTLYKTLLVEKDTFGEGLEDNKASNVRQFLVSPNPNEGNFRILIALHNPEAIRLRIYDLQGRQMFPTLEKPSGIDFEIPYTSQLSAGQYLIVLEAGKELKVEKMIVK